jgi:hypothetical protein
MGELPAAAAVPAGAAAETLGGATSATYSSAFGTCLHFREE